MALKDELSRAADPVVRPDTGETLSQAVKKLEGFGWSKSDIDKYRAAVLGTGKPKDKQEGMIDSMNPTGGLFLDYDPQSRMSAPLAANITTLDKTSGISPDELIDIFRGAPLEQTAINPGDFVTTNPELAKSYSGDGHVLQLQVPASHVLDDSDYPLGEEYLYRPAAPADSKVAKTLDRAARAKKSK